MEVAALGHPLLGSGSASEGRKVHRQHSPHRICLSDVLVLKPGLLSFPSVSFLFRPQIACSRCVQAPPIRVIASLQQLPPPPPGRLQVSVVMPVNGCQSHNVCG